MQKEVRLHTTGREARFHTGQPGRLSHTTSTIFKEKKMRKLLILTLVLVLSAGALTAYFLNF